MKKNIIYLFCAAAFLTSCSTAYRSSQTPDDVYYSPAKKTNPAGQYDQYQDDQYQSYASSSDDEYLRMKAADHYRWSNLDDFDYWYDSRYYYNNYYNFNNPWGIYSSLSFYSPYTSFGYNPWNSWYCPSYTVVYYKNPAVYYGNRTINSYHLSTYSNRNYNNYNMPLQNGNRSNAYNNNNNSGNRRNSNYNINQNRNNNPNPVRLFNNNNNNNTNINSGSRNNISSGSSGGSMSRPPRGGH